MHVICTKREESDMSQGRGGGGGRCDMLQGRGGGGEWWGEGVGGWSSVYFVRIMAMASGLARRAAVPAEEKGTAWGGVEE